MKILDISAGFRAIWFDKDNPLCTFLDIRPECNPTFVCDTRKLPNEIGKDFDLIVFDPPHENTGPNSDMAKRYGHFTRSQIIEIIVKSSSEAHRVSRENALMAFKWNDCAYDLDKVLSLMKEFWTPLFGHHMRNRGGSAAKTQTYWVMLKRN